MHIHASSKCRQAEKHTADKKASTCIRELLMTMASAIALIPSALYVSIRLPINVFVETPQSALLERSTCKHTIGLRNVHKRE